jgi:hypothetical protein
MAVPSPTVPSFVDGSIVHQAGLNALGQNITNLWNAINGGFNTQKPSVIAQQTTGQPINGNTDTLINFQAAPINVGAMWVASVPNQITIQEAGEYWVFAQLRWPIVAGATFPTNFGQANLLANGTSPGSNTIAMDETGYLTGGSGSANQVGTIINLSAGATLYLDAFGAYSGAVTLPTNFGGTFLGAVYLNPST